MTVTYTLNVSNSRLMGFSKLLVHWKGSIYKLVYKEMLIFMVLFGGLSVLYRLVLSDPQKRIFEQVVRYFQDFLNLIPLTFVLGFYVAIVVKRWWDQYMAIPWPDRLMCYIGTLVTGSDERGRLIRRTMMRWANLSSVMIFQAVSLTVKKRFPTLQHLVNAGLMTPGEKKIFKDLSSPHAKYWIPCQWFCTLATGAYDEGRIQDHIHLKTILDEVNCFKTNLGMLYSYDWISIPLVYTQVATVSVYSFFIASIMGRQYILPPDDKPPSQSIDTYLPVLTILQFFFYMGWLKVAEVLINPFGEDDDDFEMNWIIDRNYQVSMLAVDEMYNAIPELEKDIYWDDMEPELPYTRSALRHKTEPFMGSTADFSLNGEDTELVAPMETIQEWSPGKDGHLSVPVSSNSLYSPVGSPKKSRRYLSSMNFLHSHDNMNGGIKHAEEGSSQQLHDRLIRDQLLFAHSPLLDRVKSFSFQRSRSHAEDLVPSQGSCKMLNEKSSAPDHDTVRRISSPRVFHVSPLVMSESQPQTPSSEDERKTSSDLSDCYASIDANDIGTLAPVPNSIVPSNISSGPINCLTTNIHSVPNTGVLLDGIPSSLPVLSLPISDVSIPIPILTPTTPSNPCNVSTHVHTVGDHSSELPISSQQLLLPIPVEHEVIESQGDPGELPEHVYDPQYDSVNSQQKLLDNCYDITNQDDSVV